MISPIQPVRVMSAEDREAHYAMATNIELTSNHIEASDNNDRIVRGPIYGQWKDFYETMIAENVRGNKKLSSDFTAPFIGHRYRCCLANSYNGFTVSMRRLPDRVPDFREDLQLDWNVIEPLTRGSGLTLFSGIMNSGKSTTMCATIAKMDRRVRGNLGTVENPIEYIFEGSGVIQREIGEHTESAEAAIRDCVRQHRRTIMISEIRDPETANAALLVASTGLSVFATIHADSAMDVVGRFQALVDSKYEKLIPRTLRGLWWQHVLRFSDDRRPVPIYESIEVTNAVRQILEAGPDKFPQLTQEMQKQGRKNMAETALQLVNKRLVSRQEVSDFIARRGRVTEF